MGLLLLVSLTGAFAAAALSTSKSRKIFFFTSSTPVPKEREGGSKRQNKGACGTAKANPQHTARLQTKTKITIVKGESGTTALYTAALANTQQDSTTATTLGTAAYFQAATAPITMASLEDTAMTAAKEGKHGVASQKYREACEANASAPLLRVKLAIELQLAGLLDATVQRSYNQTEVFAHDTA